MKNQSKSEIRLARAVALHQRGGLDLVQKAYEEIIKDEPQCFDAIQLLGVVLLQKGLFEDSLNRFDQALKINENQPSVWSNRAMALKGIGKFDEALESVDKAIKIDPNFAESFYNKANILAKTGRAKEAILSLDRFTGLSPKNHLAFFLKGNLLQLVGKLSDAIKNYEEAIKIQPQFFEALNNLGLCLADQGNPELALIYFEQAIKIRPDFFESIGNKGVALEKMGRYEEAIKCFDESLILNPNFASAYQNKGVSLDRLDRLEEAIECYDKAISLDPKRADAYFNRGYVMDRLLRFSEALSNYNRAISLNPEKLDTYWNRSLLLLCSGDYGVGWEEYEKRLLLKQTVFHYDRARLKNYEWCGNSQPIHDKTLLLRSEQGLGDTIQFCRYVEVLNKMGANVILEVQPPLINLLKNLEGLSQIIAMGQPTPPFDYYCNLMSLPFLLGTTIETIPNKTPYLHADLDKIEIWRQKLGPKTGKRVGLVWSGGFRPDQPDLWPINKRRNIELVKLKEFKTEGIEFHSLQKGELPESELVVLHLQGWDGPKIINHADSLNDFTDTAALIKNLDLVISVDTSTAHLAGALGKPVWLMNRFDTCWRWLLERADSPWYPSFKIFRQTAPNDWSNVVDEISGELKKLGQDGATHPILDID